MPPPTDDSSAPSAAGPSTTDVPLVALFETAYRELLGTAWHLCGHAEDARDAVQEAFVRCWREADKRQRAGREPISDWRAFAFTVLTNVTRDLLRRRNVRRAESLDRPPPGAADGEDARERGGRAMPDPSDPPAAVAERRELVDKLRDAIGTLPGEEREVFLLRQNGDLAYADIGQALGIPTGTAKSRMRRALARLRGVFPQNSPD